MRYDFVTDSHISELKELEIKALIININSPGGTVSATAELEQIIYEFKKHTNTKVYFFTCNRGFSFSDMCKKLTIDFTI